ncbi:MAG: CBS domain-containing protein, partial [Myxococcales bacterium]
MRTVADLMSREVVTLEESDDISYADTVLRLGRIRHLPVVSGGRLRGLVTHRDVLRAIVARTDRGSGVTA